MMISVPVQSHNSGIRGFCLVWFLISEREKQHVNIKEGREAVKQQGGKEGNELITKNYQICPAVPAMSLLNPPSQEGRNGLDYYS